LSGALPTTTELRLVLPEVWLVIAMCAVILVPLVAPRNSRVLALAALAGLALAVLSLLRTLDLAEDYGFIFGGSLTVDYFSQVFKLVLLMFTMLVLIQWWIVSSRRPDPLDTPDFLCLLLGATLGMSLMASASNLLMIFIATESASLPSFALAGFRKRHRAGSEAALKYVVFGAASSAVMLYGMSLIYGTSGTLELGGVGRAAASGVTPLLAVGLLSMFAGIAFKLSAVPMHFWCPDVFEAAPIEVTTFLSVASKGAAVCLLLRVVGSLGAGTWPGESHLTGLLAAVAIMGAVTATWGNLLAIHQTNIKRLLAYSSIAHAGYMIMAASLICRTDGGSSSAAVAGPVLFYLLVYVFMNLGAFTAAALVAQDAGSEDIRDMAGLLRRSPVVATMLTLFLLSLFGMPGLGGFMGKVYLMKAMADAGAWGFLLIAVLLLNTLLSLYYYMRPVYFMAFRAEPPDSLPLRPDLAGVAILVLCAAVLLWTGLFPARAADLTQDFALLQLVHQPAANASEAIGDPSGDEATGTASASEAGSLTEGLGGGFPAVSMERGALPTLDTAEP
jgi:NADH-quinone oxidoreductase subunit N